MILQGTTTFATCPPCGWAVPARLDPDDARTDQTIHDNTPSHKEENHASND